MGVGEGVDVGVALGVSVVVGVGVRQVKNKTMETYAKVRSRFR